MKNKEIKELEKEIEEQTKNLIGWEGKIVIKIKGIKFNVLENHSKFVEITKLDRNKVKLQVHKSYQEKIKKLKEEASNVNKKLGLHNVDECECCEKNWKCVYEILELIDKIMRGKE